MGREEESEEEVCQGEEQGAQEGEDSVDGQRERPRDCEGRAQQSVHLRGQVGGQRTTSALITSLHCFNTCSLILLPSQFFTCPVLSVLSSSYSASPV